jgi:hypothetical protein
MLGCVRLTMNGLKAKVGMKLRILIVLGVRCVGVYGEAEKISEKSTSDIEVVGAKE